MPLPTCHAFSSRRLSELARAAFAGACVLALGGGATPPARAADHIEENLPAQAFKVMKYLKAHHYHNVGVLKFRAKKGNQPETFSAGPMNVIMATRLENALILRNDREKPPLGIIHDAGRVIAGHRERVSYLTPEGCARLFQYRYPLAWGNQQVTADAFLTGTIHISPSKGTTSVAIEVIDRRERRRKPVTHFEVRTDRTILTDVCESFVLNRRRMRTAGPDDQDEQAQADADRRDQRPGVLPSENRLVELEILYSGQPQEITPHQMHQGQEQVPEPEEQQQVVLGLRNLSDQRVAVVLAVNGKNTLYQQDIAATPLPECQKWILEPGGRYQIHGYYQEGDKAYLPFRVLSDEESEKEELSPHPRLGSIELFVFVEGNRGGEALRTCGMGLRKPVAKGPRPRDAKEAVAAVRKTTKSGLRRAGYIAPDAQAQETDLRSEVFGSPQQQELRVIWYKDRKNPPGDTGGR